MESSNGNIVSVPRRFTFKKGERLHHRTLVNDLYTEGESLYLYPLRMQYRAVSRQLLESSFRNNPPAGIDAVQIMITVPKRRLRHAVDRVLMRRRIRESYRLNRHPLLEVADSHDSATISISFIYIADKICSYTKVEHALLGLLEQLKARLSNEE